MGKVYLIGAGSGDEELITLKGLRALEKCSAVMYDRLANSSFLKYLKEECEIYYCGKEPGCHYKNQDEINEMLVQLARQGHTVGRIKGGDPYVFGRGGEEALRLLEAGIEFEVIPGITSAISVLNYAGIPVTHRGIAQSFHVFTGQSAKKLEINWEATAKLNGTLVFLMGLENMEMIVNSLLANGKSPRTACAVIMRGSTAKQEKLLGNIQNIVNRVKIAKFKSPCIIVIGGVVELSEKLNWYEKKPLFGKNICVTRSKEQVGEIKGKLLELGAQVTEINTIAIKDTCNSMDKYLEVLKEYKYIVFTSINAVNLFFNHLMKKEIDIRNITAMVCCVGVATAEAIKAKGLMPKIVAKEFVAEALLMELKKQVEINDKILLPKSRQGRDYLSKELIQMGCKVDEVNIYELEIGEVKDKNAFSEVDLVIFTSPSTVKNLIRISGLDHIKEKECIAIGPITSKELAKNKIRHVVCDEYNTEGIIKKILQLKGEKSC